MKEFKIEKADILSYKSPEFIGRATCWATRGWREKPTRATHCGLFVTSGDFRTVDVAEALVPKGVVRRNFFDAYQDNLDACEVLRPLNLSPGERDAIVDFALDKIGWPYGYMAIVRQLEDGLLSKALFRKDVVFFRKYFLTPNREIICSQLVAAAFKAGANRDFGIAAKYSNPDEIRDFAGDNPAIYSVESFPLDNEAPTK